MIEDSFDFLSPPLVVGAMRNPNEAGVKAIVALHFHLRAQGIAAGPEFSQCTSLAEQKRAAILAQEVGLEGFDDARHPHHLTLPQLMVMLLIMALMRSLAALLLPVVRWV